MGKARTEQYLAYLNGENVTIPEPFTVQDKYLYNLCKKGIGGGGNVEVDPSLTQAGKAADAGATGKAIAEKANGTGIYFSINENGGLRISRDK